LGEIVEVRFQQDDPLGQLLDLLIAISKEYAREYQRERAMPPYGRRLGSKMLMHAELRPAKANIQEPLRAPSDAYR
jgi:hypothetical protein